MLPGWDSFGLLPPSVEEIPLLAVVVEVMVELVLMR
jgi:hypothetical protein